jgi:hypothetical protein
MVNFIKNWKNIISNPFEGFSEINNETKWFLPLLTIIILLLISTSLLIPIMQSDEYIGALVRATTSQQAEKGVEMSTEAQEAMAKQLNSPMIKNITIASALGGGTITFIVILILNSLLIMLLSAILKNKIKFSLIFKIMIFISIISIVQSLIKSGITLSGDYARILSRVNDTTGLKLALAAPVSLAALFSVETLGSTGYFLLDAVTDIFNWIYYIFLYAGLKISAGLQKKHALMVTIITAVIFIIIGLIFNMIT